MAVTKIHSVKATLGRAVNYIINPDKTNEYALVDAIGCSAQTAEFDFKSALSFSTEVKHPNLAFHLIQSFKPDETDPETAHRIGLELIDKLFADKYSVVIGTHVDKHHIHNHILICAVDNIEHKKYISTRASYMKIRAASDRLCEEHGLSVIKEENGMSMSYKEWLEKDNGTSWKQRMKSDIKEAIKASVSYDEFIVKIREKGYHVKGEAPDGSKGKYISFQSPENGRWIRGKETTTSKRLGKNFTREAIIKRIEERSSVRTETIKDKALKAPQTDIIDLTDNKFLQSKNLMKWGKKENLKRMAEAYSQLKRRGFETSAQVRERISELAREISDIKQDISDNDHEIKAFAQTIKYVTQYRKYKEFYEKYQKSKNPERYLQDHISEITLFQDADRILKKAGIDPERLNLEAFKAEYFRMKDENKSLSDKEKTCRSESETLSKYLSDLDRFMGEKKRDRGLE